MSKQTVSPEGHVMTHSGPDDDPPDEEWIAPEEEAPSALSLHDEVTRLAELIDAFEVLCEALASFSSRLDAALSRAELTAPSEAPTEAPPTTEGEG